MHRTITHARAHTRQNAKREKQYLKHAKQLMFAKRNRHAEIRLVRAVGCDTYMAILTDVTRVSTTSLVVGGRPQHTHALCTRAWPRLRTWSTRAMCVRWWHRCWSESLRVPRLCDS